ncbi:hypothetical protein GF376_02985 [Candidatus Peregrinibacteria bacterium]|nr:hypothetical protein [Candidatus Peregrinibacteria bacterium]
MNNKLISATICAVMLASVSISFAATGPSGKPSVSTNFPDATFSRINVGERSGNQDSALYVRAKDSINPTTGGSLVFSENNGLSFSRSGSLNGARIFSVDNSGTLFTLGKVGIGTQNPEEQLHIFGDGDDIGTGLNLWEGALIIGDDIRNPWGSAIRMEIDTNEIQVKNQRSNGSFASTLMLQQLGGDVRIGSLSNNSSLSLYGPFSMSHQNGSNRTSIGARDNSLLIQRRGTDSYYSNSINQNVSYERNSSYNFKADELEIKGVDLVLKRDTVSVKEPGGPNRYFSHGGGLKIENNSEFKRDLEVGKDFISESNDWGKQITPTKNVLGPVSIYTCPNGSYVTGTAVVAGISIPLCHEL